MGQIKNIKLHIVTDIKPVTKTIKLSIKMFQQVARRFLSTGRPLQVHKDQIHKQLDQIHSLNRLARNQIKVLTTYIFLGTSMTAYISYKVAGSWEKVLVGEEHH